MRGRKAAVTALDGALRKVPTIPKDMPDRAAREWRKVLGVLVAQSKIADHELPLVEAYCRVVSHIVDCETAIALHGLTMVSPSGETKRRPETTMLKEFHSTLARLADALGLAPASRTKNKGGAPGGDDDDALGSI